MANILHGKFIRILFTIFVLIIISVIAKSIYIKQLRIRELSKQSSLLDKQISHLNNKIIKMQRNIRIAKADPHVIEHKVKDDFMMVDKNESIIIFKDGTNSIKQPSE